jgi:hypothetical protein
VIDGMTDDSPESSEIDIDEAMRLSGISRRTLMRYKVTGKLTTRIDSRTTEQRQRRILFRRDEIEALRGNEG